MFTSMICDDGGIRNRGGRVQSRGFISRRRSPADMSNGRARSPGRVPPDISSLLEQLAREMYWHIVQNLGALSK